MRPVFVACSLALLLLMPATRLLAQTPAGATTPEAQKPAASGDAEDTPAAATRPEPKKAEAKKPEPKKAEAKKPRPKKDEDDEDDEDEEPPPGQSRNHRFQVGLAVRAGTGYKTIAPYEDGQFCGEDDKRVCGDRQPVWLEISPSFGITKSLELLIDVRFTLEDDFADTKAFFISPGIKYYATPHGIFKFFASGQLVFNYQDMEQSTNLKDLGLNSFDFGIRSSLGLQFDVHKNFGFYIQGGVIFGFVRWLTFTVDGGGGIQVRY